MSKAYRAGGRYLRCDLSCKPRAIGELRFCMDPPNDKRMIRDAITFRGWVVHRQQGISEVMCRSGDGARLATARPNIFRPGVVERFRDYHKPEAAGFELVLDDPVPGNYEFLARTEDGREFSLNTASVTEHSRPKLLFMHIAKTAGTCVNNYFASQYPKELVATHVESDARWKQDPRYAKGLEFVSGHIRLAQFEQTLNLADYYRVTLLREPYAHVRSHLAWIKRLSEPSEAARLQRHPRYIQALSADLWNLDLSDVSVLDRFVQSISGEALQLLDNCQTRYLSQPQPGRRVNERDYQLAQLSLDRFDKVGLTEALDRFLGEIGQELQFERAPEPGRRNAAKSHYGLDVTRPDIRKVIGPLVHFDLRLYRCIKRQ